MAASHEFEQAADAVRQAVARQQFGAIPAAAARLACSLGKLPDSAALNDARDLLARACQTVRAARAHLQEELRRTQALRRYLTSPPEDKGHWTVKG